MLLQLSSRTNESECRDLLSRPRGRPPVQGEQIPTLTALMRLCENSSSSGDAKPVHLLLLSS